MFFLASRTGFRSMLVKFPCFVSTTPTGLKANLEYSWTPSGEDKTKVWSSFLSTMSQSIFKSVEPTPFRWWSGSTAMNVIPWDSLVRLWKVLTGCELTTYFIAMPSLEHSLPLRSEQFGDAKPWGHVQRRGGPAVMMSHLPALPFFGVDYRVILDEILTINHPVWENTWAGGPTYQSDR